MKLLASSNTCKMYSLQSAKDVVAPLPELLLRDIRILPLVCQDVGPEEEDGENIGDC